MILADITTAVDHIAGKDSNWLLSGAVLLMGIILVGMARYFVKQHESLINDHKEARMAYQISLKEIVAAQNITTREVAAALALSTKVIEQNSEWLRLGRLKEIPSGDRRQAARGQDPACS